MKGITYFMHSLKKIPNKIKGFTLIEVMVVVVILGILAAIVVPKIMSRPEQARIVKVKQDILSIQSALDLYKLDNGFYPSTDQGLQALISKPTSDPIPRNWKSDGYLQQLPTDPWGEPYQYINDNEKLKIFSYGPKGKDGNSEIGNWNIDANNAEKTQ
jgi:general secretion pathway protein G